MKKMNYTFSVPDNKRVRMIVSTDCKNEADDQFALAHHLMTPMFILKGIVPCHFNMFSRDYGDGHTAQASMDEVNKVLDLMDRQGVCPVCKGSEFPMKDEQTPAVSDGAKLIAEEAIPCDIDAAENNAEEAEYFQRLAGLLAVEQDFYVDDEHCKADARDCDPDGIEPLVTHHTADVGMGDAVNGTFLYRCVVDEHYLAHERYHPHRIGGDNGNPHCGIRLKARLFFHF